MRLLRMVALGAAGVVAYRLWKQKQAQAPGTSTYEVDYGDASPPHGDTLLGTPNLAPDPVVAAAQSSRGFGGP
jgi:hypothetical protein